MTSEKMLDDPPLQHAQARNTGALARLNYAIDMRYGVLHDIARWVKDGAPISIGTVFASVI